MKLCVACNLFLFLCAAIPVCKTTARWQQSTKRALKGANVQRGKSL